MEEETNMNDPSDQPRRNSVRPIPTGPERPSVAGTIRVVLGKPAAPLSWEAISAIARVVTTPDDRPIRTIVTGRRRITTGVYPSSKSGRSFPFEGMNEQAFLMHCEVDTRVSDYRAQPFRFEFVIDGAKRIYIADCARLIEGGRIEVVEVKNDRRALRDPDYAMKLTYVRDICAQLDWDFRVVLKSEIFTPAVVHANVVDIQSRRQVKFDASHSYRALDLIDRMGGCAPLGKIAEAIGDRRVGMAMAQAMMVARLIDIDLSRPLGVDSSVATVDLHFATRRAGGVS
jgi:hypothetical protein